MQNTNNNLSLSICTMQSMEDGGALRAVTPDETGIYRNVPVMVLGEYSRNGDWYDPEAAKKAMTNPKTRFACNIHDGNQEGEWGHPFDKDNLKRMVYIDRTRTSHFISGLRFKPTDKGRIVVYADIGPFKPYGDCLKESFENPNRNTSFSLRALSQKINNDPHKRAIRIMVTFDAVDGPGFRQASKRYIDSSTEDFSINEFMEAMNSEANLFSTESITDQEIQDIFQTGKVKIHRQHFDSFDPATGTLHRNTSNNRKNVSAIHEIMRGI